jgi:Ca-activated chloride channel family protein
MTTKNLIRFSLLFCFTVIAVYVFSDLQSTFAQKTTIVKSTVPTPTKSPTTTTQPSVSPTATPTPEDDEVIRIDTEEVNLNVRVVDRMNRPISDLKQGDFKIFEDGIEQKITSFITQEVPINYAIVIDNSGSLRSQLEKVIEASKIVVETNRKDDSAAVIRFVSSDKISIEQDFTQDKGLINDALDNLYSEGGQTAIRDAVYLAAERVSEYDSDKKGVDRKRRAIILVTDGEDRDSFYDEQKLFELLRESEVQIYTVGFVNELSKEGGFIKKSPMEKSKDFLNRLSQETGGKAYFPNALSELPTIARDIAKDLRTQYLVSYEPTNDKQDGSFRNIRVNVTDGPDKQKRIAITRTGRTAGKDDEKPTLQTKPKGQ